MIKNIKTIICLILIPSLCLSAPAVTNVSGTFTDGQTITITGTDFGTNALDLTFTKDNIEDGTDGGIFTFTDWTSTPTNSTNQEPAYSTVNSHSGNKSILCDFFDGRYDSIMYYDGGVETEFFITFWVYMDKQDDATTFQWKHPRINSRTTISAVSGFFGNTWARAPDFNWAGDFFVVERNDVSYNVEDPVADAYNPFAQWKRIEYWVKKSSSEGVADAKFTWHRIDQPTYDVENLAYISHESGDEDWRYVFPGPFYGNLSGGVEVRNMNLYFDDIYISDTRSRVELGNASTYTNCTAREIQGYMTAWSTTSITTRLNTGGTFSNSDTAYIYVIDSDGDVNTNGYEIMIGQADGTVTRSYSVDGAVTRQESDTGSVTRQ